MSKKSVKLYTDNVIEHFYEAIRTNNVDKLHIPHSDVFYVRKAIEARTGESYSLRRIEGRYDSRRMVTRGRYKWQKKRVTLIPYILRL